MTEKHDGKKAEFDKYVNSKDTIINKLGVSNDPAKKKTSRKRPLFANNINETRSIIRHFANQTLSDLGSLLLLVLLVLTMVRLSHFLIIIIRMLENSRKRPEVTQLLFLLI